ncbi:YbaN family protein [Devosia sp. CC-YST696]|nr:YbaN family protein [Devosia faecipullorum]MBE7733558.1 YbaN family protein [Devosia faecipullorum]
MLTALGCIMLGLGALGAVLPLLPTTPFLLAAAACFSRSFPRLEAWLLAHPRFGAPLRDWKRSGAITARIKVLAVSAMLASYAMFLLTTETGAAPQILVALLLSCCSAFILSRPTPRERQG